MVLVNEAQGYRVCLECHQALGPGEDEHAWMEQHLAHDGCGGHETR